MSRLIKISYNGSIPLTEYGRGKVMTSLCRERELLKEQNKKEDLNFCFYINGEFVK